jgi:hypothetical protein
MGQGDLDVSEMDGEDVPEDVLDPAQEAMNNEVGFAEDELKFNQAEMRKKVKHGYSASFGTTRPWQNYSISGHSFIFPDHNLSVSLGFSHRNVPARGGNLSFEQQITARSVSVNNQWFFTKAVPISLVYGLGYVSWQGKMTPVGGIVDDPSPQDRLSTPYSAMGVHGFLGLELTWFLSSGLSLSYSVVGVAKSLIISDSYGSLPVEGKHVAQQNLESLLSWGIVNLSVGWYFH